MPYTWLISLHTVGCTNDLCVLPPTPMFLGKDLCHVRIAVLVSKLLICGGIVAARVCENDRFSLLLV